MRFSHTSQENVVERKTRQSKQFKGQVSEWLKEHAWKVCIRQRIESSNLSLTAIFNKTRTVLRVLSF